MGAPGCRAPVGQEPWTQGSVTQGIGVQNLSVSCSCVTRVSANMFIRVMDYGVSFGALSAGSSLVYLLLTIELITKGKLATIRRFEC